MSSLMVEKQSGAVGFSADLQKTIQDLKKRKKELGEIDTHVKQLCDPSPSKGKSVVARLCHSVVPKRLHSVVPKKYLRFMAEECDVLELLESLMRKNVNNTQETLRNVAICALQKKEEIETLKDDLERAREEDWDAQRLQAYMAEKAGIGIYDEVSKLIDVRMNVLSEEEREVRKKNLLEQLCSNTKVGEKFMKTLSCVCVAGIDVFNSGVAQYYNFISFHQPVAVIRDSAQTLVDMNNSMYVGKEALMETLQKSLGAIEAAVEAAQLVEKYSIVAPDMEDLLESGRKSLDAKISNLSIEQVQLKKIEA